MTPSTASATSTTPANHDETVDELRDYDLKVIQHRHGYRFSLDPLLLCDFASHASALQIMDLGTGCGIIPLILARRQENCRLVGVEGQETMADLARQNVAVNGLAERITILHEDVVHLKKRFGASTFDLVVANPPFRKQGTGRLSPRAGRDLARHESTAGLADFLAVARYLVRPGGSICFVHHPSRLAEFLATADTLKLVPVRLRLVHGAPGREATMFLVELTKERQRLFRVLPPLIVRGDDSTYTPELRRIFGQEHDLQTIPKEAR